MTITVSSVSNNQTFGAWLATTNRLANLMSQNVVTSDASSGGSLTTGNSYVNGHFGANNLYVTTALSGGNVSSRGTLNILANAAFSNGSANLVTLTANSSTSEFAVNTATLSLNITGNTTLTGNVFTVNTSSVVFNSGNVVFGSSASLSGNLVFSNNVIIANGGFGTNGQVLTSNGTAMYWGSAAAVVANNGIVSNSSGLFVNANNGLTVNATGLYVTQGTGTVVNATGVHVNSTYIGTLTANNATYLNGQPSANVVNTSGAFTITGVHTHNANVVMGSTAALVANGSFGSNGQALFSNGTGMYWATVVGGASLTANNSDSQTFYLPMANTTSGSWTNGVISTTKLYFVPSTGTLNATVFNSLSDRQQKTDVATIVDALGKVMALRGVEFSWVDNGERSSGVIAQEVEAVLPDLVKTNGEGIKSVNYDGIIAYLIEAVRELNAKVESTRNG